MPSLQVKKNNTIAYLIIYTDIIAKLFFNYHYFLIPFILLELLLNYSILIPALYQSLYIYILYITALRILLPKSILRIYYIIHYQYINALRYYCTLLRIIPIYYIYFTKLLLYGINNTTDILYKIF